MIMSGSFKTPCNAQNREGDWSSFDQLYLDFIYSKKNQDHGKAMQHAYSDILADTGALFEDEDDQKIVKADVVDVIKELIIQHFLANTNGQDPLLIRDFINAARLKCKLLQSNKLVGLDANKFISYLKDAIKAKQSTIVIVINVDPIYFDLRHDINYFDFTHFRHGQPFPTTPSLAPAPAITALDATAISNGYWEYHKDGETYTLERKVASRNPQETRENMEELRALKKLIIEKTVDSSRAVSYSEYYQEKLQEGRVEMWQPTPEQPSWDPSLVQLDCCLAQATSHVGSEKSVVKPFWKSVLHQHKILPEWNSGYEIAHLGTKVPDISFFAQGTAKPVATEFVAVGDCKGSNWSGTSSSEKGQILLYLHRMLDAQPERQFGYGFMTNNKVIILIKGYRSSESPFLVRWCISSVLSFEQGMKVWLQLMREDSGYVGPAVVDGYPITFHETLRPGGTCRAFGAKYRGKLVVAKLYSDEATASDNASRTNRAAFIVLQASQSTTTNLATVPTVVVTGGNWLLIEPKGTPLKTWLLTKTHIDRLVNTLQVVHAAGIIHRDVRVSNIFFLTHENVLLNDWGSSVTVDEGATLYAGAPEPHIHPQIPLTELYQPSPQHDLYSLVSSIAQLLLPGANTESRKQLLHEAFEAADTCDYGGVCLGVQRHMR
jgi:hypothetical protein